MSVQSHNECPLCHRPALDLLMHLRIRHDVQDPDDYLRRLQLIETDLSRQKQFREYVEELKAARERNEISAEEYQKRIVEWEQRHSGP